MVVGRHECGRLAAQVGWQYGGQVRVNEVEHGARAWAERPHCELAGETPVGLSAAGRSIR